MAKVMQVSENEWKFTVDSTLLWNDSGVPLLAGVSYRLEPVPGSFWYDSIFKSGPEGYRNLYVGLFHGWLRVPQAGGAPGRNSSSSSAPLPKMKDKPLSLAKERRTRRPKTAGSLPSPTT